MSWPPVFSSSGSHCSLHNPGWRFGDYFLQIIGYVDTGFVVVEVTACSFVVFLKWRVRDGTILLSILNMFTYPTVEGNWEFFTPYDKGQWRVHADKFLHMTVQFQSLSCISAFLKYRVVELTFWFVVCDSYIPTHQPHIALGLQLDSPEDVRHQMNVFYVFTLYLGETCSLHFQGELPCFADMKNYDMSLSLNQ